ncbi:MAG: transporter substrate-binding domain-containing protein [Treponema sp.]|nr:transporter substrate-binding domain-containing protein [Treponema sp.]
MRVIFRIIFLIFVVLLFTVSGCRKAAVDQDNEPVRIASFRDIPGATEGEILAVEALKKEYDFFVYGMTMTTESFIDPYGSNGEIKGYSALFCRWMTDLFGIQFKPVLFDWGYLFDGLASGDIDFTGDLMATDERRKTYYMTEPIAQRSLKSFKIAGRPDIHEIIGSRLPRLVFLDASAVFDRVSEVAEYEFEAVFVSKTNAAYDLLKNNKADAFLVMGISEASFDEFGDVVAETFLPLVYNSASMSTQNPKLEPVISLVEKLLQHGSTHRYLIELYEAGYQEYCKNKLFTQLTYDEHAYIQNNPVVKIGVDPGNYPACFYDKREKQWRGIFFDILKEVEILTGLSFERANDEKTEWPVIYQMLVSGEVAFVPEFTQTAERAGQFVWPDTVQMVDYYALISKSDLPNIKVNEILHHKVGMAKNTAYGAIFRKWFPDHMYSVEYESMEDAFMALQNGEVDMVMANQKRLLYLTHYQELPDYKANILFDQPLHIKFGFNKDEAVLCSIIDKTLRMIDLMGISDQWIRKTYDYRGKLAEAQLPWLIGSSALLLSVLALVAILFLRNRHASKELENLVKQRTHDLKLQTATLTTLFDSIPDMIFTKDLSLRYMQCNKSLLEHFNICKEDIIGKNNIECLALPKETADMHDASDIKVIREDCSVVVEEHVPRFDGVNPLYETVKSPLKLDDVVIGVLGIARDITKRKEMEELALSASRSKSVFLANMSHEIRTPMNSIVGFSELALDGEIPTRTRDYLKKILENAEWLLQIINDILDISKIESGKMELENIPFNIHELFASCRTLILPKAAEKGINLYCYSEPSIGKKPLGDPTRLRQVLVNLLSNAVKFTNTGMVKLHAAIMDRDDTSVTMHFEVRDSGIGMTPEQMEKIFDPFMQAETGTTRKYGGTGLGLAITRNMVNLMGGTLAVTSTPGVGSKFCFELTFNTINETDNDIFEKNMLLNEIEKPSFSGEILLCEDNVMNQQVIREHLTRVGLVTVVAENGKIGVEMVRSRKEKGEKQFDLIFMDMHMPVMDGLEAAECIFKLNTGVSIVAMTANVMSNDREIYRAIGIEDCVGKPFSSQELWRCLLKYFKPASGGIVQKDEPLQSELEFMKSLYILFAKSNQNIYKEIVTAIKDGDIKLAYRLAHTLKSNAGQLGKMALQKAAADVEFRLRDGENRVADEQLQLLEAELVLVLNEFAPLLDEPEAHEGTEQVPLLEPEKVQELFQKLEDLLKSGNPECINFSNDLYAVPGDNDLIHKLILQMNDFEFEGALSTLTKLKGSMQ